MIHIIAGKHRGRRLELPPSDLTRPTSQRSREAIFNIIAHSPHIKLVDAKVLDLFAGSGAMGLEALSRGACHVTFVEKHPKVRDVLKRNISLLGAESTTTVLGQDAVNLGRSPSPVDLVLMDPPYDQGLETAVLANLRANHWLTPMTMIVLETGNKVVIPPDFDLLDERRYGKARISFLKMAA